MTADLHTWLAVIRFEHERERQALATERLLRGGWDAPTATPGRFRRLLAAAVRPPRRRPRPALLPTGTSGSTPAAPLLRRGVG